MEADALPNERLLPRYERLLSEYYRKRSDRK